MDTPILYANEGTFLSLADTTRYSIASSFNEFQVSVGLETGEAKDKGFCLAQAFDVDDIQSSSTPIKAKQPAVKSEPTHKLKTNAKPVGLNKKMYICASEGCNFTTQRNWNLQRHLLIHGSDKPKKCVQCDKQFFDEFELKAHLSLIHKETPIICEICSSTFKSRQGFNQHKRRHKNDYRYKCNVCSKGFFIKSHYMAHYSLHMGIKLHKCSNCHKEFSNKCSLKVHENVCQGGDGFRCDECQSVFTQKTILKNIRKANMVQRLTIVVNVAKTMHGGPHTTGTEEAVFSLYHPFMRTKRPTKPGGGGVLTPGLPNWEDEIYFHLYRNTDTDI